MISSKGELQAWQQKIVNSAELNAVIRTRFDKAEREIRLNNGTLSGYTFLVKDNIAIKGEPLSCGSKILEGYESPYSSTVVNRILSAGGAIIGQTNQDEFAMGSSTEYTCYGPTKNPFDPNRVPGGSSGGSAAAVAVGLADMALGSDTGGSVRQPAAFCGVYGLKPTYGRVSRFGLVAFASSFDQIGTFATTIEDTANLFVTIAGHDPKDVTSAIEPVPQVEDCLSGALPKRVGVPRSILQKGVSGEILDRLKVLETFCLEKGIEVQEVELPNMNFAVSTYYILVMAEASSNLARFDGVRYGQRETNKSLKDLYEQTRSGGFGAEVKRRIMLGTYILSAGYYDAYYSKAQKVRRLIRNDFMDVFDEVDLILLPTTPTTAFKIGENINDPLAMYLLDIFTIPMSLAGVPAINIPAGMSRANLPIGLQLVGNYFREETILSFCRMVENAKLF